MTALCQQDKELSDTHDASKLLGLADTKRENKNEDEST